MISDNFAVKHLIEAALHEDLNGGVDVTTEALVDPTLIIDAQILTRQACCVAGIPVATEVFRTVNPAVECTTALPDGSAANPGDVLIKLHGPAAAILTAERTALNFMQRLCGIATVTRMFVLKCSPYNVAVLDTRKTTPGHRVLEKYAVTCGGGANHRMGLYDRVLIKDNHRGLWCADSSEKLGLAAAVAQSRRRFPGLLIEIEIESEAELAEVLPAEPDWILLDNMPPEIMARCVKSAADRNVQFEASGGITLETVQAVAASGIDAVSLGCLTHSSPAVDLSLELA